MKISAELWTQLFYEFINEKHTDHYRKTIEEHRLNPEIPLDKATSFIKLVSERPHHFSSSFNFQKEFLDYVYYIMGQNPFAVYHGGFIAVRDQFYDWCRSGQGRYRRRKLIRENAEQV